MKNKNAYDIYLSYFHNKVPYHISSTWFGLQIENVFRIKIIYFLLFPIYSFGCLDLL